MRVREECPGESDIQAFVEQAMADIGGKPMIPVSEAVSLGLFSRSELYRRGPGGTGEIEWRKFGKATRIVSRSLFEAAARMPRVVRSCA